MSDRVEPVLRIPTILGEGPFWSVDEQALYWLDIFRPTINRYDPATGSNEAVALPGPIYAAGLRAGGGFVAAMESGFATLSRGFEMEVVADPNRGLAVNFNDGKVDRRGRFWSGTMARDWESPIGTLFRLDPDGSVHAMEDGIVLSNGLGWSPDDAVMYHTDFKHRTIYAYDFDADSGAVSGRRPFIVLDESDGCPDGLTVDREGCLWVAHWDGWCVTRHDERGREVLRLDFPVPRPTCPAFGGPDMSVLYVTSATMHLTEAELAEAPLSGALFAVETGTRGVPEPRFGEASSAG
ncbi:MAG: gluconolactonase [Alphaproteobacteria bacterium]|nr:MAG: gluconolactonase [Alphaproteobacteria bacterium]